MPYLQPLDQRPDVTTLSDAEEGHLARHFDAYGAEMVVDGQVVRWEEIQAVEVVVAPHVSGPAGWFVKRFILRGEERYHVGIYFSDDGEAVLPNITWDSARHVVQTIAYYAPNRIDYKGPDDLVPLMED
jgi:hypothetical protein